MDKRYRLRVLISKQGSMKYFSQLDMVRILERAARRTGLPFYITKGFNPHIKMSFREALKLGQEGRLEVTFYFDEKVKKDEFREKFSLNLPRGLGIIDIEEING
jgi:radical SAM-linked protein